MHQNFLKVSRKTSAADSNFSKARNPQTTNFLKLHSATNVFLKNFLQGAILYNSIYCCFCYTLECDNTFL